MGASKGVLFFSLVKGFLNVGTMVSFPWVSLLFPKRRMYYYYCWYITYLQLVVPWHPWAGMKVSPDHHPMSVHHQTHLAETT